MIASYEFSERVNAQVILWAIGGAIVATVRALVLPVRWLVLLACALWAARAVVWTVAKALGIAGALAATVALVAMIPPVFWLGLGITAALAYVSYPRSK